MIPQDPNDSEPRLITRRDPADPTLHPHDPVLIARNLPASAAATRSSPRRRFKLPRLIRAAVVFAILLAAAGTAGFFYARHWVRSATVANLPQLDGTLRVQGLNAPVTVQRDAHGVPHIRAASLDDLIFAQAFITAQDRLFQMDTLRRLAAGELAEILGPKLLPSDELQRFLQLRAAADRAVAQLPPAQLHLLQVYAAGVNASIAEQRDRLPVEFRVLHSAPVLWTPRDSILVQLIMFEDLTNRFESKLAREALTAQLTQSGSADLIADLYPTSSWRDHTPADPQPDLTIPGPPIQEVPLDESQSHLASPDPLALSPDPCSSCFPGSNNWVVSGAHTASGKPLLSNDMHLNHSLPGIWYEADLEAPIPGSEPLHVAGVTLPGVPLVVVGHNDHIAWGFTNLGADVQDLYLETTRGSGDSEQFQAVDGSWQPVLRLDEPIKVRFGRDVHLTVRATRHGDAITPILTPLLKGETRQIALRWTAYDTGNVKLPVLDIATAHDWPSFLAAFAQFGGPAQNVVYADDRGHIGYHAAGRIPLRGPAPAPSAVAPAVAPENPEAPADIQAAANQPAQLSGPLSAVPLVPGAAHEWSGYIPFDRLPQVFDPPSGVIATANARVAPKDYPYPITLDWGSSYRTERILHLLLHRNGLTPADMLAVQTDVYSDFDRVLAQRLAYALDRSTALAAGRTKTYKSEAAKNLRVAADLLRTWNGRVTVDSPAAEIVANVHAVLWPMLLQPHLKTKSNVALLYQRYGRDFALEEIVTHTPQRWLPPGYANWDDFLTDAVAQGLDRTHTPRNLAKLRYGADHTVEIESPIFAQSEALRDLLGRPTGTGEQPQSGDGTTVKQVGHTFGPSERFTANLANLDQSTLNLVTGQSGNPDSPWFLDQFAAWYRGTTYPFPYSTAAVNAATTHTLTLVPK